MVYGESNRIRARSEVRRISTRHDFILSTNATKLRFLGNTLACAHVKRLQVMRAVLLVQWSIGRFGNCTQHSDTTASNTETLWRLATVATKKLGIFIGPAMMRSSSTPIPTGKWRPQTCDVMKAITGIENHSPPSHNRSPYRADLFPLRPIMGERGRFLPVSRIAGI